MHSACSACPYYNIELAFLESSSKSAGNERRYMLDHADIYNIHDNVYRAVIMT